MPRPNVLFLVADDLRPQLGCYGLPWVRSPHTDALAAEALLFERAYCQQAVCAPSRSSVLSGCRPDTTRIHDLKTPLREAMPDVLSLPQHFKAHGYETVSVGKIYHHPLDDLPGWSREPFRSEGDWQGRGYLTDEALEEMRQQTAILAARGDTRSGIGPAFEAADVDDEAYPDGKDATAAIAELRRLARGAATFFLAVGFHKPHLPFNAPKRYWDGYDPAALPLAANPFAPEGATEFSLADFGELRGYFGLPPAGPVPEALARKLVHGYCACVSYMDAQLGRVLAELRALGRWDDTVIVFWGDHGWKLGEHGSWCKHTNFETDTRAPLIARIPGAPGNGRRTDALVEFVDLYPGLCEACGIPVPPHVEGDSFAPLLRDPGRPWKTAAFSQYPRRRAMGYAMRTRDHRYVEWKDRATGATLARELYDHAADAAENRNLAAQADPALLARLSAQLAAGWRAARPPGA